MYNTTFSLGIDCLKCHLLPLIACISVCIISNQKRFLLCLGRTLYRGSNEKIWSPSITGPEPLLCLQAPIPNPLFLINLLIHRGNWQAPFYAHESFSQEFFPDLSIPSMLWKLTPTHNLSVYSIISPSASPGLLSPYITILSNSLTLIIPFCIFWSKTMVHNYSPYLTKL